MKKTLKYISFIMMLVVMMTSCKSHKKLIGSLTGPNSEMARYETVVAGQYKYEALQSKIKLSMGKSSLNGKICIESGKRLCLSANAPLLGFEIGRIEATRDSVLLVDKYHKIYAVIDLVDITMMDALEGHEMEALECLMLGRIFIPGKGQATSKDYQLLTWSTPETEDGNYPFSTGVYAGNNYELAYTINALGQLENTTLTTRDGKKAVWQYASYGVVDNKNVATAENIIATNKENKEIRAGISFNNPSLGESTWKDFEPTASYRRVTFDELASMLKELAK